MKENDFILLSSFSRVHTWWPVVFLHLLILFTCSHCLFPPTPDTDFNVEAVVSHVLGFMCWYTWGVFSATDSQC